MTICVGDQLLDLSRPCVMGILNCTPDSFYAPSRAADENDYQRMSEQLSLQGAKIIDIGACSTRPGGEIVPEEEELARLRAFFGGITECRLSKTDYRLSEGENRLSEVENRTSEGENRMSKVENRKSVLSLDTFRAKIAREMVREFGPMIVNDVTEGSDPAMFETVAELGVPYVLTSNQSNICDMAKGFARKIQLLRDLGQRDIILDPGFGFGKTVEESFALLRDLDFLLEFELPILIGFSRKSMIYKTLGTTPKEALNGTTVLNTLALQKLGCRNVILRVHDVKEALECIKLCYNFQQTNSTHVGADRRVRPLFELT